MQLILFALHWDAHCQCWSITIGGQRSADTTLLFLRFLLPGLGIEEQVHTCIYLIKQKKHRYVSPLALMLCLPYVFYPIVFGFILLLKALF